MLLLLRIVRQRWLAYPLEVPFQVTTIVLTVLRGTELDQATQDKARDTTHHDAARYYCERAYQYCESTVPEEYRASGFPTPQQIPEQNMARITTGTDGSIASASGSSGRSTASTRASVRLPTETLGAEGLWRWL